MPPVPIKVLLVEDSPVALEILLRLCKSSPEIVVVGTACNGKEALELIPKVQPQVICTDLHMSGMNGLELTRQVMARYPRPILVISNSVQADDPQNIFQLLQAGAVDILPKPIAGTPSDYNLIEDDLITKIKVLAGVKVFPRPLPKAVSSPVASAKSSIAAAAPKQTIQLPSAIKIIAIGSSTGGPQALQKVLTPLPSSFPVPILCTQHISEGFLQGLVNWLGVECHLKVKIAVEGETLVAGTVYFAPDQRHLELNPRGRINYGTSAPVEGHRPSVTRMFQSVAKLYGKQALGILLTGMGQDGAVGMQDIAAAGGITIAQDEKTCVVFGMPKQAIDRGAVRYILPLQEIAPLLIEKI
jgi:two-component system, chemotaxis family, protein-glutamate methylesterase/glutaminase